MKNRKKDTEYESPGQGGVKVSIVVQVEYLTPSLDSRPGRESLKSCEMMSQEM